MRRDDRERLLGSSGTETLPDGRVYRLRPGYASGLGCASERRILLPGREPKVLPGGPGTPVPAPE